MDDENKGHWRPQTNGFHCKNSENSFHLQLVSQSVMSIMARSNEGGSIGFSGQVAGVCFPVVKLTKVWELRVPALNYGINN